jgi:hypothetical protein
MRGGSRYARRFGKELNRATAGTTGSSVQLQEGTGDLAGELAG